MFEESAIVEFAKIRSQDMHSFRVLGERGTDLR